MTVALQTAAQNGYQQANGALTVLSPTAGSPERDAKLGDQSIELVKHTAKDTGFKELYPFVPKDEWERIYELAQSTLQNPPAFLNVEKTDQRPLIQMFSEAIPSVDGKSSVKLSEKIVTLYITRQKRDKHLAIQVILTTTKPPSIIPGFCRATFHPPILEHIGKVDEKNFPNDVTPVSHTHQYSVGQTTNERVVYLKDCTCFADAIKKNKKVYSSQQLKNFLYFGLDILRRLNQNCILHLDLKPSSIYMRQVVSMWDNDFECLSEEYKLLFNPYDLINHNQLANLKQPIGHPEYRSPEVVCQWWKEHNFTFSGLEKPQFGLPSNLWSFGLIVHQLATGSPHPIQTLLKEYADLEKGEKGKITEGAKKRMQAIREEYKAQLTELRTTAEPTKNDMLAVLRWRFLRPLPDERGSAESAFKDLLKAFPNLTNQPLPVSPMSAKPGGAVFSPPPPSAPVHWVMSSPPSSESSQQQALSPQSPPMQAQVPATPHSTGARAAGTVLPDSSVYARPTSPDKSVIWDGPATSGPATPPKPKSTSWCRIAGLIPLAVACVFGWRLLHPIPHSDSPAIFAQIQPYL